MNLGLWRHAEAADGAPDLERELTTRGRKQAARVGDWLRSHLPHGFEVIASPAVRTRQTAEALIPAFTVDDRLAPWRDAKDYLAVAGWPPADDNAAGDRCLVLVGHQPIVGWTASTLLTGEPIGWSVKKGAAWWLHSRVRDDQREVVLRTVLNPDML
ncbi:MAG TPA: histidine phosphatase family protein [Burkholderiaceae bacterium]|nr:histidine phosphatase family protein [Burkholderiaceae bacterium]